MCFHADEGRASLWRPFAGCLLMLCFGACASSSHSQPLAAAAVMVPAGLPKASAAPLSLRFQQSPGRTSRNQTVTLTNQGSGPLVLGQISISGPHANEFAREISSSCVSGFSVAPGASCVLAVNFTPGGSGPRSAELVIPHNGDGAPTTISLRGNDGDTPQRQ